MKKPDHFIPRLPTEEEQQLKAEVRDLMTIDRCRLLERQPFVGHLAMHLELVPVIDCRMNTASTDGIRLFVDAEFYKKMDEEERLGVLGHEVWHCALRHFARRGGRDKQKFNYACDVEADILLYNAGFKVEILPYDKSWIGKSAEQIYDLMLPAMANFQKPDLHLDQEDQPHEKFPQPKPSSGGDEENENNGIAQGICTRLPRMTHDTVFDPDFTPAFDKESAEEWKENLKDAIRRQPKDAKGIGNLPGNVEELIKDDEREATVDWKKVLLDFVSQIFGGERQWLPPARRYVWKKLYLPSRARKQTIEIVLAIDTSGSTTPELPDFLAELRGMVGSFGEYKLTIIQCDTAIHSVKEYSNDDPMPEDGVRFHGFGGTSLIPPFQYVEEKMPEVPTVFIYLTDGFGTAPADAPAYPVIWCLTSEGVKPVDWGLEIKIEKNDNSVLV